VLILLNSVDFEKDDVDRRI